MSRSSRIVLHSLILTSLFHLSSINAAAQQSTARSGREVYETVCITCHGPGGRGGVNPEIEKIVKPPDFSDCAFAAREPDRGFLAVALGPVERRRDEDPLRAPVRSSESG